MNNQELAMAVKKHKLIQKLMEQQLATPSLVNQLIAEEVMQEEKTAPASIIRSKLNQLLKKATTPDEVNKIISDFVAKIKSEDEKLWTQLFPKAWPKMDKTRKASFMKSGAAYTPDIQKRIAAAIKKAAEDGQIDDAEKEQLSQITVEPLAGLLTGGDSVALATKIREYAEKASTTASLAAGGSVAYALAGGPVTLTMVKGIGWTGTAMDAVALGAAIVEGNKEAMKANGIALGIGLGMALIPGGEAAKVAGKEGVKVAEKEAAKAIIKDLEKEAAKIALGSKLTSAAQKLAADDDVIEINGQQYSKKQLEQIGQQANQLAKQETENKVKTELEGKELDGQELIKKAEADAEGIGLFQQAKNWFSNFFGGDDEEETTEAPIDVAAAQKRYGTLIDRFDFNIGRIRGKEEEAKQALLKLLAILMQSGLLKEYLGSIQKQLGTELKLKDALKKLEKDERNLVLPVLEKNAQPFVNMLKGESLPQESDWFKTLDDQKQQAVQMFVKAYGSQLSEGLAGVTKRANLQPELVKAAIKEMEKTTEGTAAWKIVKNIMINEPDSFAEYLLSRKFGTKEAQPEEATPQPEGEIDFDPSKPMRKQEAFAKNLKIYDDAVSEFERRFMRVPLLFQQQKIYVDLLESLEELFDQKKALTRTDKGESPTEEPEVATEALLREEPTEDAPVEPEERRGAKFFDVDPKVMRNIKIDLRYIEDAIKKLHIMFEDFILKQGATKRFSEEAKGKIITYAKRLQLKIAESYQMISSIGPMNEDAGAELTRDEKIDMVEDVWDNTVPQLKELNTLMDQAVTYEKVHGKANEIVDLLKTISEFFPQTAKFTSDAKRGSKKAIAELDEKIKNFNKEALPRIYALLKDDKIDSTKLNRTLMELKILSETIQELLGIKSQISGAPTVVPSDDPNEPSLSDEADEAPPDETGEEEEEVEDAEEEEVDGDEEETGVKELTDPLTAVNTYKSKFPFKEFQRLLETEDGQEPTIEMYNAFMTLYMLIRGQMRDPADAPRLPEEKEKSKFITPELLKNRYLPKVFENELFDETDPDRPGGAELQKVMTSIKLGPMRKKGVWKGLSDLFNNFPIAKIANMRKQADLKLKNYKLVNWSSEYYPKIDFTIEEEDPAPESGGLPTPPDDDDIPPGLEEQLVRKLHSLVEQVMLDVQEEPSEVEYIAKLLWGDDDLQGQLIDRMPEVLDFIRVNNENLGYDEEWGGSPNLVAPYASLEGSNLILHLEDQPVQFDLTDPHQIKDLTFHLWFDRHPIVSYREGFLNKLKAASWGIPDMTPEEKLQEKLVPIIERMLGDHDG